MRRIKLLFLFFPAIFFYVYAYAETPGDLVSISMLCLQNNKCDEAIKRFDEVTKKDPKNVTAYSFRARCYALLGDHPRAIEDFSKAIQLDQNEAGHFRQRGDEYAYLGDNVRALRDYDQAISLNPTDPKSFAGRGNVYASMKDHIRAIENYGKAIELTPAPVLGLPLFADINRHSYYCSRGDAFCAIGDFQKAAADYTKAIELKPEDPFAYGLRGISRLQSGNRQQAIDDFRQAAGLGDKRAQDMLEKLEQLAHSEPQPLRLACSIGKIRFSVMVDVAAGTVNGLKANISEERIRWSQVEFESAIDRYTGALVYRDLKSGHIEWGQCVKVTEKQF